MTRSPISLAAIAVLLAVRSVAAQPAPLALEAAQAEARRHAPDGAALAARVEGAEAIARQAGRRWRSDPEVALGVFQGGLVGQPDESAWTLGARWTVDVSRSWVPRAQSASQDVERARFEREDGLRALDERVAVAFANVALAQRLVARSERLRQLQAIAAAAEHRRLEVGNGTELEADSADLDLAGARAVEEQASGDLSGARVRLARLLGRADASALVVEDPAEPDQPVSPPDIATLVDRDPRVHAAQAELRAARLERDVAARLVVPMPTFGVDAGSQRREIPAGSFQGLSSGGALSAQWQDPELLFTVGVPLPLFDRQREPTARATARILAADTQLAIARADVRSELQAAWEGLQAARRAFDAVAPTAAIVARDLGFVEQAVRAGAFDALTRTQTLRRLEESGRRIDTALRDLRAARAVWIRETAGLLAAP